MVTLQASEPFKGVVEVGKVGMNEANTVNEETSHRKMQFKMAGEAFPERDSLAEELIVLTGLYRDITMLISCYAQTCIGEEVGSAVVMSDVLEVPTEYYPCVIDCLNEHLKHGEMRPFSIITGRQEIPFTPVSVYTRPIIDIIVQYMTQCRNPANASIVVTSQVRYRVYQNVIYFYDTFERNVLGYIAMSDTDHFVFTPDTTLDCFVDLDRRINDPYVALFHNRTDLRSNIDDPKMEETRSTSTPTDVDSDVLTNYQHIPSEIVNSYYPTTSVTSASDGEYSIIPHLKINEISILHRASNKMVFFQRSPNSHDINSQIFEINGGRFIDMRIANRCVAFYRIDHCSQNAQTSYTLLQSPKNLDRFMHHFVGSFTRWRCLNGALLGYNLRLCEIIIVCFPNDESWYAHTFKWPPLGLTQLPTTAYYALCGRWLVEISYYNQNITVRRFSVDLRVVT